MHLSIKYVMYITIYHNHRQVAQAVALALKQKQDAFWLKPYRYHGVMMDKDNICVYIYIMTVHDLKLFQVNNFRLMFEAFSIDQVYMYTRQ